MTASNGHRIRLMLIDAIAFRGGSKVSAEIQLTMAMARGARVTVLSKDALSWRHPGITRRPLFLPAWLGRQVEGLPYFAKQGLIALQAALWAVVGGGVDRFLGPSGPGVDLAVYLAARLLRRPVVQLVQGPVAASRLCGRALQTAERVFYLPDCEKDLRNCLARGGGAWDRQRFRPCANGVAEADWPTPTRSVEPVVLWAASLLRWKGLDVLTAAIRQIGPDAGLRYEICYLRPAETNLDVSRPDRSLPCVTWSENPYDLDVRRSHASIFVSTSRREPFGNSILEAMAAGLCPVIPDDGAYWSRILRDGVDCVLYRPNDVNDLALKLKALAGDPTRVARIGTAAYVVAKDYGASTTFREIVEQLLAPPPCRLSPQSAETVRESRV